MCRVSVLTARRELAASSLILFLALKAVFRSFPRLLFCQAQLQLQLQLSWELS